MGPWPVFAAACSWYYSLSRMNISASSFASDREELFFNVSPCVFSMHFIKKFIPHSCVFSTCLPMESHFPVL